MSQENQIIQGGNPWLKILMIIGAVFIVLIAIGSLAQKNGGKDSDKKSDSVGVQSSASVVQKNKEYVLIYSVKGKGNRDTESFDTSGGNLKITATTTGGSVGSFSGISLKSEYGDELSGAKLMINTEGREKGAAESIVRGASASKYYLHVISGINWEINVYEEK